MRLPARPHPHLHPIPCPPPAENDLHVVQVLTGIQAIGDRLYELAEAGIPMPRELTYYDHIGDTFMPDLMRPPLYRAPGVEYTPPDPQWERVQRLGHSWGAVDLRAHVEKRAAKKLRAVVRARGLGLWLKGCSGRCDDRPPGMEHGPGTTQGRPVDCCPFESSIVRSNEDQTMSGRLAGLPTSSSMIITVLCHPPVPVLVICSSHAHWPQVSMASMCTRAARLTRPDCGTLAQEWQQERREQFRFTYNEVSMYTDMRMRDDPFTEPLDQSHEEIMEGILRGRPAQTIPVRPRCSAL